MNKCHQEVLDCLREEVPNEVTEHIGELMDKDMPMKTRFENGVHKCDRCNEVLRNDYIKCPTCGQRILQKIDWSK